MPAKGNALEMAVVIHTEEEFDWNGGFNRNNTAVTHHSELKHTVERLVAAGAKVTLALDYAFVDSEQGAKVVRELANKHPEMIEFGAHLHPWVTPPFVESNETGRVENSDSFPGNLPYELEKQKLTNLTERIEQAVGKAPQTYLAGRYGIGENSYRILKELGYTYDVSPSAYSDFTSINGPDFSTISNRAFIKDEIKVLPHTSGFISPLGPLTRYFYDNTRAFDQWRASPLKRLLMKVARVKKFRLSSEGVDLRSLKLLHSSLQQAGVTQTIFSLHSSSLKSNLTPYSSNGTSGQQLADTTVEYVQWALAQGSTPARVADLTIN